MNKKVYNDILSQWLSTNNLGNCDIFNAKLTERGCGANKATSKYKLEILDFTTDQQEVVLEYCANRCSGIKFN